MQRNFLLRFCSRFFLVFSLGKEFANQIMPAIVLRLVFAGLLHLMFDRNESWLAFILFVCAVCLLFPAALGIFLGAGAYIVFRYILLRLI